MPTRTAILLSFPYININITSLLFILHTAAKFMTLYLSRETVGDTGESL
jgi:hypothetical protein